MRVLTITAALFAIAAAAPVQAQLRVVSEARPATMLRTDEIIVRSEAIGRDFIIEVTRPEGEQPGRKYPVVYALDGGFGVAGLFYWFVSVYRPDQLQDAGRVAIFADPIYRRP